MLYALGHILRDKMPWIWDFVDMVNSLLFSIRYGKRLRSVEKGIVNVEQSLDRDVYILTPVERAIYRNASGWTLGERTGDRNTDGRLKVVPLRDVETERLVEFFICQPEEAFKYFRPHGFDNKAIDKLKKNRAFLGYVLTTESKENKGGSKEDKGESIVGYCFLRSFVFGKGFRGRIVDVDYRGKGIGTLMNKMMNEVGFGIGLHLFETVNKDNVASYKSVISSSNFKIVEELPGNELFLEILQD